MKQSNSLLFISLQMFSRNYLNLIFLVIFSLCFNSQLLSQDTLKSEGFLIVDYDENYFVPIKGSFAKKKSIDFKDFKFKKGFNLSLTTNYFDKLTKSKGIKYCVHPYVNDEKGKYIYVLPCKLFYFRKENNYKPTLIKKKYNVSRNIKFKFYFDVFYYPIKVEQIR